MASSRLSLCSARCLCRLAWATGLSAGLRRSSRARSLTAYRTRACVARPPGERCVWQPETSERQRSPGLAAQTMAGETMKAWLKQQRDPQLAQVLETIASTVAEISVSLLQLAKAPALSRPGSGAQIASPRSPRATVTHWLDGLVLALSGARSRWQPPWRTLSRLSPQSKRAAARSPAQGRLLTRVAGDLEGAPRRRRGGAAERSDQHVRGQAAGGERACARKLAAAACPGDRSSVAGAAWTRAIACKRGSVSTGAASLQPPTRRVAAMRRAPHTCRWTARWTSSSSSG